MDFSNRKYQAAWILTTLWTALFLLPELASFIVRLVGINANWSLMDSSIYVQAMLVLWAAYFGANTAEKFSPTMMQQTRAIIDSKNKTIEVQVQEPIEQTNENEYGGQPLNSDNP